MQLSRLLERIRDKIIFKYIWDCYFIITCPHIYVMTPDTPDTVI